MQSYDRTIIDPDFNPDRYLVCPITGSKLIYTPNKQESKDWYDPRPRDSGYRYVSSDDPNLSFKTSPFEKNKLFNL